MPGRQQQALFRQCLRTFGEANLPLASVPQSVGSSLERKSEQSNRDSSKGGDSHSSPVKKLADLNGREWDNLIAGAIFFFGLFGYFAYFIVTRDERKNENDKSRASAEPKKLFPTRHP
jgi:hypothetical protein